MNKPLVYLAGGITGLVGYEATDWRVETAECLNDYHIESLDPLRGKKAFEPHSRISNDFHDYEKAGLFFTDTGIMLRDYNDVRRADALLVNLLGTEKISVGTCMELAWAYSMQKPAVVAIEPSNIHLRHPMVSAAIRIRVSTLDEAISTVASILGR